MTLPSRCSQSGADAWPRIVSAAEVPGRAALAPSDAEYALVTVSVLGSRGASTSASSVRPVYPARWVGQGLGGSC